MPRYSVSRRFRQWSEGEIEYLQEHINDSIDDLVRGLPRRSKAAIKTRLSEILEATQPLPEPTVNPQTVAPRTEVDTLDARILERLQRRASSQGGGKPYTLSELASEIDRGPASVDEAVRRLQVAGYRVGLEPDAIAIKPPEPTGYTKIPLEHFRDGKWFRFGALSDSHLCNKHARIDVLNAAYDHFQADGIRRVFHGGNWIEGQAHFNKLELLTPPGFENQVSYFLDHYPQREGIESLIISGDDHEGWFAQREGIDVGRRLEQTARDRGRTDIVNLGYAETDIPFWADKGKRAAILRIMHGGGGAAYALTYPDQRMIESFQGGEKPQINLMGHHHKALYIYYRDIHALELGCVVDQTLFLRKRKIPVHVGFWVIEFQVDPDGSVKRFRSEWFPFFDRTFYEDKYPVGPGQPKEVKTAALFHPAQRGEGARASAEGSRA